MVKMMAATAVLLALMGCEQQYRYPCHDPENWETDRCKKPLCEINRDCPEHILKGPNGNGSNVSFGNSNSSNNSSCNQCNNQNAFKRSDQKGANR